MKRLLIAAIVLGLGLLMSSVVFAGPEQKEPKGLLNEDRGFDTVVP